MNAEEKYAIGEDLAAEFIPIYGYDDDLRDIAKNGRDTLTVDWSEYHAWDPELANAYLDNRYDPETVFNEALRQFDAADEHIDHLQVEFTNLPDAHVRQLHEITKADVGGNRTVEGTIEQVTTTYMRPVTSVYECRKCRVKREIDQPPIGDLREPSGCDCQRQGTWQENQEETTYCDEARINLKQPASESPDSTGQEMVVVARDDCLTVDGEHIQSHVGAKAEITGEIRLKDGDFDGTYDTYLFADHIEVNNPNLNPVDIDKHRETFERLAARSDAVDLWLESLAPQMHEAWQWPTVKRLALVWLFGSPRIDYDGQTYRGDIHAAVISDPGMAKSQFCRELKRYSPKCMHRSATGISSDVGLTAAAVQDQSFGSGKPTLKPGILVRGNGGHVILEEIDKGPDDLERMNDGLEGEQRITVDKWGLHADLETRVGLFVTGNPRDGTFDPSINPAQQLEIDSSLMSRFDGLVTMQDAPDEETDRKIAEAITDSYREAAEAQFGDREDFDRLERPIDPEVGRAWIAYARRNIHPILTDEAMDVITDWFVDEARQLNDTDTRPATARYVETGMRFANAFARIRLSDTATVEDAERAIDLTKTLVGETYDSEAGEFNADYVNTSVTTTKDVDDRLRDLLQERHTIDELCNHIDGVKRSKIERQVSKLSEKGEIYEPEQGVYVTT